MVKAPSTAYKRDDEAQAGDDAAVGGGRRVGGQQLVDHPRLAADLGDHPAALHGHDRGQAADRAQQPEQPLRRQPAVPPPRIQAAHSPASSSKNPRPDHHVEAQVDQPHHRRPVGRRDAVPAGDLRAGAEPDQQRIHVRDPQAAVDVPVDVDAAEPFRDVSRRARDVLHRRELHRLVVRDGPGRGVADEDLERGQHRRRDEPEGEAGVVVAVPPADARCPPRTPRRR